MIQKSHRTSSIFIAIASNSSPNYCSQNSMWEKTTVARENPRLSVVRSYKSKEWMEMLELRGAFEPLRQLATIS